MSSTERHPSPPAPATGRRRTVIMVHGGEFQPDRDAIESLWREALAVGLDRDFEAEGGRGLLDDVDFAFVYYADLTNPVVSDADRPPDPALDLTDQRQDLQRLAALSSRKKFRRQHYEVLPGKSALPELLADVSEPLLNAFGLSGRVLARHLPALHAYLADSPPLRAACEGRVMNVLAPILERGDDVLLLGHALGSVVCYDALWRLSRETPPPPARHRVDTWITFGSPLGSTYVKHRLRGAEAPPQSRYPGNLVTWYNVSAEDDYLCHDKTVADDFAALLKTHSASRVRDFRIYNLAVRYGKSDPHNAIGYLVHPRMAALIHEWLSSAQPGGR